MLEGEVVADFVAHFEAEREAADHSLEGDGGVAILGIVLDVGSGDGSKRKMIVLLRI